MLAADREALVCDLAETYGIMDYRALPVPILATLAAGLRDNSRIKMRLTGTRVPVQELLLAIVADKLSLLVWFLSEDGRNGVNRPASFAGILLGEQPISQSGDAEAFATPEAFEQEWRSRTGVGHG